MAKFIDVTVKSNGSKMMINIDRISHIEQTSNGDVHINLDDLGENYITIKESRGELKGMING